MLNREKRTKRLSAYVRPEVARQLELFKPQVISMSDYLAGEIERIVRLKRIERDMATETKSVA